MLGQVWSSLSYATNPKPTYCPESELNDNLNLTIGIFKILKRTPISRAKRNAN
jgi:hypothetical protein